jgi:hypothetical protein
MMSRSQQRSWAPGYKPAILQPPLNTMPVQSGLHKGQPHGTTNAHVRSSRTQLKLPNCQQAAVRHVQQIYPLDEPSCFVIPGNLPYPSTGQCCVHTAQKLGACPAADVLAWSCCT